MKCARGFSTKLKRSDINKRVSSTLSFKLPSDEKKVREAIRLSTSIASTLIYLECSKCVNVREQLKKFIHERAISITHFKKKLTPDDVFVSGKHPAHLFGWMLKSGWEEKCALCDMGPEWNGQRLRLQVDHIDGGQLNNVKSNLRLLCPNCHSQTPTYCWKNAWRKGKITK